MTEMEWYASTDCISMLKFVAPELQQRKIALVLAGSCDAIEPFLPHICQLKAIDRFFVGIESTEEFERQQFEEYLDIEGACYSAESLLSDEDVACVTRVEQQPIESRQALAGWTYCEQSYEGASLVSYASWFLFFAFGYPAISFRSIDRIFSDQYRRFVNPAFVRDIFGNPFRPFTFDPTWQTSATVSLAQSMYDSRDFAAMPVLADALEEVCRAPQSEPADHRQHKAVPEHRPLPATEQRPARGNRKARRPKREQDRCDHAQHGQGRANRRRSRREEQHQRRDDRPAAEVIDPRRRAAFRRTRYRCARWLRYCPWPHWGGHPSWHC